VRNIKAVVAEVLDFLTVPAEPAQVVASNQQWRVLAHAV
jgi:hypothetical protein